MRVSHVGWNLAGLSLPLLVAALTVPHLVEVLGKEKFGLLALAWGLIGYAGVLDLGIGRAVTQLVSRLRASPAQDTIPDVLATASRITLIAGLAGGTAIALGSLSSLTQWIKVESTPSSEITSAILLLAIALPAQAMSSTYRGINEAFLNFKGVSLLRIALGIVNFGGPYVVSIYTGHLAWLVSTLVISRIFSLIVFRRLANNCVKKDGVETRAPSYSSDIARSLFSFGGWIAVSSVVSPLLMQADRFLIASTISAAAVAVYVVPYEVVVQSLILVGAMSSVIFPSLTRLMHEQPYDWKNYFYRNLKVVAGLMLVVCAVLAAILPTLLSAWMGEKLTPQSSTVGQILCIGVFFNSIGAMFYALLHAKGRADITAKLHLIEVPLFIIALLILMPQYGILGAAIAWVMRMLLDSLLLIFFSKSKNA
jgi:O-antigen/teichoic acid export membrane protein